MPVGRLALLDRDQRGAQPARLGAHAPVADPVLDAAPHERADAGEHRGCARQRRLAALRPVQHLLDAEHALGDVIAEVPRQRQQGIAGDAVQEGAVEAARQQLAVADHQEVGCAGLLHLATGAEQHLVDAVGLAS